MTKHTSSVAVIGAGLTGLTAAYYLRRAGIPVRVFEQGPRAGGAIRTCSCDGFTWECGPNTGVLGKPEVRELFDDLAVPELLELAAPAGKKRYIWKGTRWEAIPDGIWSGLRTPLFSWKDKIGLPFEIFRPRGTDPEENLSSMVRRRLGQSILDYAVDPFVSGVYAGSPDVIIPRYALPKLYHLEQQYGGFLKGAVRKKWETKTARDRKATRETFSAQGGLQSLIDALVERIEPENLQLNCRNLTIRPGEDGWEITTADGLRETHAQVISTVGAHALPDAFPFLQNREFEAAFTVRYARVVEIAVGFRKWHGMALDGFGGLVPSRERRDILGVLFLSSLMQKRAPAGGALFAVFAGGLHHPEYVDLPDSDLKELVAREFVAMMGVADFEPDLFEINRHVHAIPQYDASTPARIAAMESIEANHPGLLIGGNGRGGIGMADRIAQARQLAERCMAEDAVRAPQKG